MASTKKYVYFGKRNTNVCYNGVSFPVAYRDVIVCHPEFIAGFISEKDYKEVLPGSKWDTQKPRHTFGRPPMVLRRDPTGGLPMQSTPGMPSKKKVTAAIAFDERADRVIDNPYDLGLEEPKTEISTLHNISSAEPIPRPMELDVPMVVEEEEDEKGEPIVQPEVEEESQDVMVLGKTVLRKASKQELFDMAKSVVAEGCSLRPEMAEELSVITEETTRGPIFEALWKYYGHNAE